MHDIMQMINEDSSSYFINYAINYVTFLKTVSEVELKEITNLSGDSSSYREYLRRWVNEGGNHDDEYWVASLLDKMRNANRSESVSTMLTFTMMIRVGVYRARGEVLSLPLDANPTNVTRLTAVQELYFY